MIDIAQLLIDNGADMNMQEKVGLTALMSACFRSGFRGHADIASLLIDSGTDILSKKKVRNRINIGLLCGSHRYR